MAQTGGPRCSIARLFDELTEDDAAAVRKALASKVDARDLSDILRGNGHRIMTHTIRRHRRDECSCSTATPRQSLASVGSISGALALLTGDDE